VPIASAALVLVLFSIPNGFPHQEKAQGVEARSGFGHAFRQFSIQRLDWPGTALLLLSTLSLVAALEEAGLRFPWRSPLVIVLLTFSGFAWIAFFVWERRVTLREESREPIFPWRFARSRVWIGMLLYAFLFSDISQFSVALSCHKTDHSSC
jgi:hypothetical protein